MNSIINDKNSLMCSVRCMQTMVRTCCWYTSKEKADLATKFVVIWQYRFDKSAFGPLISLTTRVAWMIIWIPKIDSIAKPVVNWAMMAGRRVFFISDGKHFLFDQTNSRNAKHTLFGRNNTWCTTRECFESSISHRCSIIGNASERYNTDISCIVLCETQAAKRISMNASSSMLVKLIQALCFESRILCSICVWPHFHVDFRNVTSK